MVAARMRALTRSGSKQIAVSLIDTVTGETWSLARTFDGKQDREGWTSVGAYSDPLSSLARDGGESTARVRRFTMAAIRACAWST